MLVKLDHFPKVRGENNKYLSCHHQDSNHFGSCGVFDQFDHMFSLFTALTAKHVQPNKDLPHRRKKVFSMYRKKTKTSNQTSMGIELRFGFSKPNFCTNVRCLKRFQLTSQRNQENFANVASQKSLNKFYL